MVDKLESPSAKTGTNYSYRSASWQRKVSAGLLHVAGLYTTILQDVASWGGSSGGGGGGVVHPLVHTN
jgi:hypothetical protein